MERKSEARRNMELKLKLPPAMNDYYKMLERENCWGILNKEKTRRNKREERKERGFETNISTQKKQ